MASTGETPSAFLVQHEVYTLVRLQQVLDELMRVDMRPYMYFTIVEDLHGLGLQHFNLSALQKWKKCVRISQDYCPEMVKRIIIIRAPWIFPTIWNIAQHF